MLKNISSYLLGVDIRYFPFFCFIIGLLAFFCYFINLVSDIITLLIMASLCFLSYFSLIQAAVSYSSQVGFLTSQEHARISPESLVTVLTEGL